MAFRLFITDFDGTLLNDHRVISQRDLSTLALLREQGVVVVIATGRSLFSFERALLQMGLDRKRLPVDFLVFSTGAGILDLKTEEIIRRLSISRPETKQIIQYFNAQGFDYTVQKAIPDTPYFLYKSQGADNPDFQARISLYDTFATPLTPETPLYRAATQVLAVVPRERMHLTLDRIRADLPDFSVIHATSPLDHVSFWIEVFHREVSKSQAADWLAKRLGISRQQTVAVGNDYNDQDLLSWSGRAYVVANGAGDLTACERLPMCNNRDGVTGAAGAAGLVRF